MSALAYSSPPSSTPSKWLGIDFGLELQPNFLELGVVIDDGQPEQQLLVSLTVGYIVMHSKTYTRLLVQERTEKSFCKRVVKRANVKASVGCERMIILFDAALRIRSDVCVRPHA